MSAIKEFYHDNIEKEMKAYMIPMTFFKPFVQYLLGKGLDIKAIADEVLESEWLNFLELANQAGGNQT
jgi:hypothetical protein